MLIIANYGSQNLHCTMVKIKIPYFKIRRQTRSQFRTQVSQTFWMIKKKYYIKVNQVILLVAHTVNLKRNLKEKN